MPFRNLRVQNPTFRIPDAIHFPILRIAGARQEPQLWHQVAHHSPAAGSVAHCKLRPVLGDRAPTTPALATTHDWHSQFGELPSPSMVGARHAPTTWMLRASVRLESVVPPSTFNALNSGHIIELQLCSTPSAYRAENEAAESERDAGAFP